MGGMVPLRDTGVPEERGTEVPEWVSNGCHAESWNKEGEELQTILCVLTIAKYKCN